jgi:hypothetical protein
MISACAILAVYNEADIICEAVNKLISHGVDVYLIDNASTDGTAEQVNDLVGRGLVDIETVRFTENEREVYDWTALLKLKEQVSRRLGYDWYLHADADEVRYPPWPGLSLREGLDRVDKAGYNLVNFKLFNFRLTKETLINGDFETSMRMYTGSERFNQRQVKAWKSSPAVDIACLGGHQIRIPEASVFPTRFILKHYPVRSLEHGQRKILEERKNRFSLAERKRGWHVQYDHLQTVDPADVFWDSEQLVPFNLEHECLNLLAESNAVLSEIMSEARLILPTLNEASFSPYWAERLKSEGEDPEHVARLLGVATGLARLLEGQQDLPSIGSSPQDAQTLHRILGSLARMRYLSGDPLLYDRLPLLRFH